MKKILILMLFGCFLFSSCYMRRHGRTAWTKHEPAKEIKSTQVKPS